MATEKNTAVKGIIAIIAIMACIVIIVTYQKSRTSNAPRPIRVITIDVDKGEIVEVVHKPGDKFPLVSSATGENTLYQAFVDKDEKYLFPGHGIVTMSPTGSRNVGSVSYGDKEYRKYPVRMEFFRR